MLLTTFFTPLISRAACSALVRHASSGQGPVRVTTPSVTVAVTVLNWGFSVSFALKLSWMSLSFGPLLQAVKVRPADRNSTAESWNRAFFILLILFKKC